MINMEEDSPVPGGEKMKYDRKGLGILRSILWGLLCVYALGMRSFAIDVDQDTVLKLHDEGKPYLYGSRYQCQVICRESGSMDQIYWNAPEILNLTCRQEGVRHSIPVYCMDGVTAQSIEGNSYRRINLEDRVELDGTVTGKLRAILTETFPFVTVEEIALRVNRTMGEGSVRNLTQGEVIAAAQQAIWTIGNGGKYTVDRIYVSIRGISQYDLSEFVYPESLTDCAESVHTWNNIGNLYRYYLELAPIMPMRKVLTAESFQIRNCDIQAGENGTYGISLRYEITADIAESGELFLTVSCGDQIHICELKQGSGSCIFLGLVEPSSVCVSVEGYQTGGDVYLFSAGEHENELIGYDNSCMPVSIQFTIESDEMNMKDETKLDEIDFEAPAEISTFTVEANDLGTKLANVFLVFSRGFFAIALVLAVINVLRKLLQCS